MSICGASVTVDGRDVACQKSDNHDDPLAAIGSRDIDPWHGHERTEISSAGIVTIRYSWLSAR